MSSLKLLVLSVVVNSYCCAAAVVISGHQTVFAARTSMFGFVVVGVVVGVDCSWSHFKRSNSKFKRDSDAVGNSSREKLAQIYDEVR